MWHLRKVFGCTGSVRTTVAEMAEFTSDGEIAVARLMGQIVGCVRVRRIDQETGEFGMLAVGDQYQGTMHWTRVNPLC
jgi:N-acetylglutamate synthase-like GNAT family acetyltransferase